jgi:sugar phosphate permease
MDKLSLEESKRSYYGWVVVGMAFLAELLAFGMAYSFGVFFKPLASEFGWTRAATAGAFSAYAIIHDVLAPVTGRMTDRFGPRVIVAIGGFCIGLAMFLMSHVTAIWQIYLFYGFIFALGVTSIYAP